MDDLLEEAQARAAAVVRELHHDYLNETIEEIAEAAEHLPFDLISSRVPIKGSHSVEKRL